MCICTLLRVCFLVIAASVFMVIMWQNNMRENEHTFRLLHVCFPPYYFTFMCMSSKSQLHKKKKVSWKNAILFVPFSALASYS